MNFNPSFFHLIKSPYWWQFYLFWVLMALLSFSSFYLESQLLGYIFGFIGAFTYFLVCFGVLFIKAIRNFLVREGAYWNKHHKIGLFNYSFISGILSLNMLVNFLSVG